MEHFKIVNNKTVYTVVPTAAHLNKYLNKLEFPYDTNWEIYKLYNYGPREFCQFMANVYGANVKLYKDFPFMSFSFSNKSQADVFLAAATKKFSEQEKT